MGLEVFSLLFSLGYPFLSLLLSLGELYINLIKLLFLPHQIDRNFIEGLPQLIDLPLAVSACACTFMTSDLFF